MYYVYILCDPRRNNQPFYVGKGTGDRAKSHLYETYQSTANRKKWCKIAAIKRAGLEVYIDYPKTNLNEQEAYDLEASLIKQYGRIGLDEGGILTNICEDNRPPSARGRVVSAETRRKHSERQLGELNHRYGKSWSEEEKEQRRQFNLENGIKPPVRTTPHSDETKAKMSAASKGRKKSPEHCKAIGDSKRGRKLGTYSKERVLKSAQGQYRNYKLTSPDGKVYHVNTGQLKEMIKIFKFTYGGIMAAKVKGKPYKGWTIIELPKLNS
jgi:hypothetical protein